MADAGNDRAGGKGGYRSNGQGGKGRQGGSGRGGYDRSNRSNSRYGGKGGGRSGGSHRDGHGYDRSNSRGGYGSRDDRGGSERSGGRGGYGDKGRSGGYGRSGKPDGRGPARGGSRRFDDGAPRDGQKSFRPRSHGGTRRDGERPDRRDGDFKRSGKPQGKRDYANRDDHGKRDFKDRQDNTPEERKPQGFAGFKRPQGKTHKPVRLSPARSAALDVLTYIHRRDAYLAEGFEKVLDGMEMGKKNRAFARLLATEVVARCGSLDDVIEACMDRPTEIEDEVRDALRISLVEMLYLDKPDYATVDQGVELVRSVQPKAVGFANFLLHKAIEVKEEFPFGDPAADDRAAALKYGFPAWAFTRLVQEQGRERALLFMERSNEPAPLFFMVNLARANGAETLKSLVDRGFHIVPVPQSEEHPAAFPIFAFAERTVVGDDLVSQLLHEGALVISDASAQSIAALALPASMPKRFIEIGAGRGTKTILLQNAALSRFSAQMPLDTLDSDSYRTRDRRQRLKIARIEEGKAYLKDATDLSTLDQEAYDAVFVDAPCSGYGTLRRHTDIRWRMTEVQIASVAAVGKAMLEQAAGLVAPGGQLTYATCTVFAQENEQVIEAFLQTEIGSRFKVKTMRLFDDLMREEAHGPLADAHFACVLERVE